MPFENMNLERCGVSDLVLMCAQLTILPLTEPGFLRQTGREQHLDV